MNAIVNTKKTNTIDEDGHTHLSKEALKSAFLDNLYSGFQAINNLTRNAITDFPKVIIINIQ
jgi:hypothetical protein